MPQAEKAELPKMPTPEYKNGWNTTECLDWLELTVMASKNPDGAYHDALKSLEDAITPSEAIQNIAAAKAQFLTALAQKAANRGEGGDIRTWQRRIGLSIRRDRTKSFDDIVSTIVSQWETLSSELKNTPSVVEGLIDSILKSQPSLGQIHRAKIIRLLNIAIKEAGYTGELLDETHEKITNCAFPDQTAIQ
ncbi:MAG: hypothetical protein Q8P62_04680 [Candidatus Peregrinibacteria bacterium]|nr:hypothetical protein [Candidatus Peregrinibacteria bacterium]